MNVLQRTGWGGSGHAQGGRNLRNQTSIAQCVVHRLKLCDIQPSSNASQVTRKPRPPFASLLERASKSQTGLRYSLKAEHVSKNAAIKRCVVSDESWTWSQDFQNLPPYRSEARRLCLVVGRDAVHREKAIASSSRTDKRVELSSRKWPAAHHQTHRHGRIATCAGGFEVDSDDQPGSLGLFFGRVFHAG